MSLPSFYTSANRARVSVAAEVHLSGMKFQKQKGVLLGDLGTIRLVGELDVVGVSTRDDGSAGPRFSDVVKFSFDRQDQADAFVKVPYHYENQVEFPEGRYSVTVAFSSGGDFGRAQAALSIEPWSSAQFAVSGIAFGKARRAPSTLSGLAVQDLMRRMGNTIDRGIFIYPRRDYPLGTGLLGGLDSSLLNGLTPLTSGGVQLVPTGATRFSAGDALAVYLEIHAPGGDPARAAGVTFALRVLDKVSGAVRYDSRAVAAARYAKPGSAVIPVEYNLQWHLSAGSYQLEVVAQADTDKAERTVEFEWEEAQQPGVPQPSPTPPPPDAFRRSLMEVISAAKEGFRPIGGPAPEVVPWDKDQHYPSNVSLPQATNCEFIGRDYKWGIDYDFGMGMARPSSAGVLRYECVFVDSPSLNEDLTRTYDRLVEAVKLATGLPYLTIDGMSVETRSGSQAFAKERSTVFGNAATSYLVFNRAKGQGPFVEVELGAHDIYLKGHWSVILRVGTRWPL